MITRRGVGLLIVAICGFFVASATRVGWLHVADALLVGMLLLSALLPHLTVARLKVKTRFNVPGSSRKEPAPRVGDDVQLELSLVNRSWIPRVFLSAFASNAGNDAGRSLGRAFFPVVPARGSAASKVNVKCSTRGWYRIDTVRLETRAPFGLFKARRRRGADSSVLVYPLWYEMKGVRLIDTLHGDRSGRRPARRGEEVAGSRRYVAGDAMRDMHWKNTARTGRPTVREFDAGVEEALTIALETGLNAGEGQESTLEYSISIAASVGRFVLARGGTVRLGVDGKVSEPVFDWLELMKLLAVIGAKEMPSMSDTLREIAPGSRVLAIVPGVHASTISAVINASRQGNALAAVVLERFTDSNTESSAARDLLGNGVPAVVCLRGQMGAAITAIERGVVAQVAAGRAA